MVIYTSFRGRTVLLLYVDDIILTGDDSAHIDFVKQKLCTTFPMTDLGQLRYFLGIEVTSHPDGYQLSQQRYTLDLLARSGLTDTRTAATPMELHLQLSASDGTPLFDPSRYRHLVGSLVYLTVTRPDISHAVHILSQFVSAPTSVHYRHLLRVLRYLRGTASRGLFYLASLLFNYRHTLMLPGRAPQMIGALLLVTASFLVLPWLSGRPRSSLLSSALVLRLRFALLLLPFRR